MTHAIAAPASRRSVDRSPMRLRATAFALAPLLLSLAGAGPAHGSPLTLADAGPRGQREWHVEVHSTAQADGAPGFVATALLAGGILFALAGPAMPAWRVAGMLGSAAVAATVTELACDRLDDNFAIPLLCGGVAALWMIL